MAGQLQYKSGIDFYEGLRPRHPIILPAFLIETPDNLLNATTTLYDHQGNEIRNEKAEEVGFKPFSPESWDSKPVSPNSRVSLEEKVVVRKEPIDGWEIATNVVINGHFVPVYSLINPDEATLRRIIQNSKTLYIS